MTPEDYKIITQVMAEVKDEVVESARVQNEVLRGEATLYNILALAGTCNNVAVMILF